MVNGCLLMTVHMTSCSGIHVLFLKNMEKQDKSSSTFRAGGSQNLPYATKITATEVLVDNPVLPSFMNCKVAAVMYEEWDFVFRFSFMNADSFKEFCAGLTHVSAIHRTSCQNKPIIILNQ